MHNYFDLFVKHTFFIQNHLQFSVYKTQNWVFMVNFLSYHHYLLSGLIYVLIHLVATVTSCLGLT